MAFQQQCCNVCLKWPLAYRSELDTDYVEAYLQGLHFMLAPNRVDALNIFFHVMQTSIIPACLSIHI